MPQLQTIFTSLVTDDRLHARWLNTLSLMENTGARKISASEDKTSVSLIILKHAAEEHRHAYYLKKQIAKLGSALCPTYHDQYLVAPAASRQYLHSLDVQICRYLKQELHLGGAELKFAAYLLVTYAIEVRADDLYPIYQQALDEAGSRVNVKSIILEEEGHLEEMLAQLKHFSPEWETHAQLAVQLESCLFDAWMQQVAAETIAV